MRIRKSKYQKSVYLLLTFIFIYCWITLTGENRQQKEYVYVKTNNTLIRKDSVVQRQVFVDKREENLRRQQTIVEICSQEDTRVKKSSLVKTNHTIRTLTDPNYSFIYCRVNKAASTFIIDSLERIFNCSKECMYSAAERLYNLPPEEVREITDRAYKFMFVREPYGRLFSAYSNKFYFPKGNWAPVGPAIAKRYRQNPSADSLKYGHDVTFAELIRYIVEKFEDGKEAHLDDHVRSMHIKCNPFDYKYNFIGKQETLSSDWGYLMLELKSRHLLENEPSNIGAIGVKFKREMEWLGRTLRKIKESNISIHNIYERAWSYFQITGDISKHIQMPYTKYGHNGNNRISYKAFLHAHKLAANLSTINATEIKGQRREAMLQAYSSVPLEYLERLRKMVMKDCLLYGYDDRPKWVFDRERETKDIKNFNYFKGLN